MSEKKVWALCLHAKDNVATVLKDVPAGEPLVVRNKSGQTLGAFEVVEAIPRGHKTAVVDIPAQSDVIKYGEVIGRSVTVIAKGAWVHVHNMESLRGRGDPA